MTIIACYPEYIMSACSSFFSFHHPPVKRQVITGYFGHTKPFFGPFPDVASIQQCAFIDMRNHITCIPANIAGNAIFYNFRHGALWKTQYRRAAGLLLPPFTIPKGSFHWIGISKANAVPSNSFFRVSSTGPAYVILSLRKGSVRPIAVIKKKVIFFFKKRFFSNRDVSGDN